MSSALVTLALCLAVASRQSFVDTAPLNEVASDRGSEGSNQDSSVKELENLKHSLDKTLSMIKTHTSTYTRGNGGHQEGHAESTEQVNENGKMLARVMQTVESKDTQGRPSTRVRTEVDVPEKGIHKSVVQQLAPEYQITENGNRRSSSPTASDSYPESGNSVDKYNTVGFSGTQYSPLDMAEYVFWTGDEKGVTLAIEEFLQEGLMTREEAITFLQEIKNNLDYLKNHYTQLGLNSRERSKESSSLYPATYRSSNQKPVAEEQTNSFDVSQLRQEVNKKRDLDSNPVQTSKSDPKTQDEDYDELLQRLRVADFLYTEYSLEEVIYQLAKVMFTQSLTRGSAEAQQALQKFTNFLEVEAEQGHISRALEKKVLDVVIASLSDTLTEHPELLAAVRESLGATATNAEGQHFLRQILEISPDDKARAAALASGQYKDNASGIGGSSSISRNIHDQIKENTIAKLPNRIPLGLGKYKNP